MWLEDASNGLTTRLGHLLSGLSDDLNYLEERITGVDGDIREVANTDPVAVRLQQLRGVGPLIATALIATVGNGEQFTKGRQMAAWIGLAPSSQLTDADPELFTNQFVDNAILTRPSQSFSLELRAVTFVLSLLCHLTPPSISLCRL
jgi:hypothetical protein